MSPRTTVKTEGSPAVETKRRAISTSGSAKKRSKKSSSSKPKPTASNGSSKQPTLEFPDGWESMSLYKSFLRTHAFLCLDSYRVVSNERFELNDTIFVNSLEPPEDGVKEDEDPPSKTIDETDNTLWVAAVIEVRAQSPWNVWARVEWFYRPDELPVGRQPYHGKREVIKSPVQDIISAHAVAGHADVTHWEEMDDSQDSDGIDGLFWRQTYDPTTNKLSVAPFQNDKLTFQDLRRHCICQKPYNPDTTMFWCDKCKLWEHEKCLAAAIRKNLSKSSAAMNPAKFRRSSANITIATDPATGEVTAIIKGKSQAVKSEPTDRSDAGIKSENEEHVTIPVKCLKCGMHLK